MPKQQSSLLGISRGLIMILFSITSVYAVSEELVFTIPLSYPLNFPNAVTTDSQDRILVGAPLSQKIFTYDSEGNLLSTITNSTINPSGLSVDTNGRIIVSDVNNHSVNVFNSAGVWQFTLDFSFNSPYDLATDSNNRIIVSDTGAKETRVFDSNGISVLNLTKTNANDSPDGVATDLNDRIIIGDIGNNKVHVYESDGTFVFSIDESTPGSPFIKPYRVTTDTNNRIIVADSNSSTNQGVFIYDSDGNFLHSIQDSSLDIGQTSGITSDSNDRIIVADKTNSSIVKVFRVNYGIGGSDNCDSDCIAPDLEFIQVNKSSNWLSANNTTFKIGDKQEIKFRYSDNRGIDNIREVELGLGLPTNYSPMHKAETILEINTDSEVIKSFKIKDENNLFVENSITLKVDKVNCISDVCSELEYTLGFIWAERPFTGYFLITGADYNGNISFDRSVNEFKVIGETLNEQPVLEIYNRYTSTTTDELFIQLTRIDKILDIWIDEKDRKWHHLGNDRFELIT